MTETTLTHRPFDALKAKLGTSGLTRPELETVRHENRYTKKRRNKKMQGQVKTNGGKMPTQQAPVGVPIPDFGEMGLPLTEVTPYKRVVVESFVKATIYTLVGGIGYLLVGKLRK